MATMNVLFRVILGLEEVASQEIGEKLQVIRLILSPYGSKGWIKCEIVRESFKDIKTLRSIVEAYIILVEESYSSRFSIDRFAEALIKEIPAYAPHARKISISAYSSHKNINQREIQGAISRRITQKLDAECNFKNYDTALRVSLLPKKAVATLDLEIQPANLAKNLETHPTPILPPIAYCMIRLVAPQQHDLLLDPMCGCGTIPCMAALEWKDLRVAGSDISGEYVSCAKRNAEALGIETRINFSVADINDLTDQELEANFVVLNPPYGITVPIQADLERLYNLLFTSISKILLEQGQVAIITPYPQFVEKAIQQKRFHLLHTYPIHEGKLVRTIQIIQKI
ncbi:MAG: methyltransferase [Candidatus Helarchaeota archaeon]|nr:methyltransferase [Candidatus Helarchaeota archaeon]